ncbi:hypothetical protein TURU_009264 [Turdus rufiventris]|nr:hypothetical protein TURU_009264 [Turdus rufiventris]
MFPRVFCVRANTNIIMGSDWRKPQSEVAAAFPTLSTEQLAKMVPNKEDLNVIKIHPHKEDVYMNHRNPMLFEAEKVLYPTVHTLSLSRDCAGVLKCAGDEKELQGKEAGSSCWPDPEQQVDIRDFRLKDRDPGAELGKEELPGSRPAEPAEDASTEEQQEIENSRTPGEKMDTWFNQCFFPCLKMPTKVKILFVASTLEHSTPEGSEKSEILSAMEESMEGHQGYVEDHKDVNEVQRTIEETSSHGKEFHNIKAITPKEELLQKRSLQNKRNCPKQS